MNGIAKHELPDHSSRFGYPYNSNGYGFGHFPGKYVVPPGCCENELPLNMAPKRFYNK